MECLFTSNRFCRVWLIATLCLGATNLQGTVSYPEERFPELRPLMQEALLQSPETTLQLLRIEEARGSEQAASAANKPRLYFSSRVGGQLERRDITETETSNSDDLFFNAGITSALTLSQPIYSGGGLKAQKRAGELRLDASKQEMERIAFLQLTTVRNLFFDLLLEQRRLFLREQNLEGAERALAVQEQLLAEGRTSEQALIETRILVTDFTDQKLVSEQNLERIRQNLAIATGQPTLILSEASMSDELLELDFSEELAALTERVRNPDPTQTDPGVAGMETRAELEAIQAQIFEARDRPRVDLVASVFQDRIDDPNSDESVFRVGLFSGIQVNWTLFDANESSGLKREALARQRWWDMRATQLAEAWQRENENLISTARYLEVRYQSLRTQLELQDNRLALRQQQAGRGEVAAEIVLRDQAAAATARVNVLENRLFLWRTLISLQTRLQGDPVLQAAADSLYR